MRPAGSDMRRAALTVGFAVVVLLVAAARLPLRWDWREKGAVTPVSNEGQCGATVAITFAANAEGTNYVVNRRLVPVSAAQVVECGVEDQCFEGSSSSFGIFRTTRRREVYQNGPISVGIDPYAADLDPRSSRSRLR